VKRSWPFTARCVLYTAGAGLLVVACTPESRGPTSPDAATDVSTFEREHPHVHLILPAGQVRPSAQALGAAATDNGIYYHGGPVIYQQKVAAIYWSYRPIYLGGPTPGTTGPGSGDTSLIGFFLSHLGGSPYYNINTTYYDAAGTPVQNSVTYTQYWASNTNVPVPGVPVSDSQIQAQIVAGFTGGQLTYDPNTLYVVFSDALVNLGGAFGSVYCAYRGTFTWNGNDVKYAPMPHEIDHNGCTFSHTSPNNDPAADAEVNDLAHETEETQTDADRNAWYDNAGQENADKCWGTFGTTYTTANGATANVQIGGKDFLVQANWVNANGGGCILSW
jgi:hypothetical protein